MKRVRFVFLMVFQVIFFFRQVDVKMSKRGVFEQIFSKIVFKMGLVVVVLDKYCSWFVLFFWGINWVRQVQIEIYK